MEIASRDGRTKVQKGGNRFIQLITYFQSVLESIWMEVKYIANYKMGYTIIKNIVQSNPKVDMKLKRTGHVCVLTGAGRGIGFEILKLLLQLEYTVVLGVRNARAMQNKVNDLRRNGTITGHVKIFHLDLKSLGSVQDFSEKVLSSPEAKRIDLLINHAGIMQQHYELTENNIECQFQVNYLSHFLLTNLLLARIKETAKYKMGSSSCHIINTTSTANHVAYLDFDDLAQKKVYVPLKCYCDSKLCQVMHAKIVQRQLENEGVTNIHMYAVHPGEIATDIWNGYGVKAAILRPFTKTFCRSSTDAANVILFPALTDSISEGCGGKYYNLHEVGTPGPQAYEEPVQQRLWDLSTNLTEEFSRRRSPTATKFE